MRNDASAAFASNGFVRLGGFHPGQRIEPIRRAVLEQLKQVYHGRGLPRSLRSLPAFQQIGALSRAVEVPGLHAALMTRELSAIVAGLGGRSPSNVQATQLLLSPPQQGAWTLQGLNWHVDVAADARAPFLVCRRSFSSTMSPRMAARLSRSPALTGLKWMGLRCGGCSGCRRTCNRIWTGLAWGSSRWRGAQAMCS